MTNKVHKCKFGQSTQHEMQLYKRQKKKKSNVMTYVISYKIQSCLLHKKLQVVVSGLISPANIQLIYRTIC